MPPQRHIDWTSAENILGFIFKLSIEHGPTHMVIELFAFYLWCIRVFNLFPGPLDDVLVIADGFPVAETFHLLAHAFDEIYHQILQFSLSDSAGLVFESLDELDFIFAQIIWQGIAEFKFQGILAQDRCGFLLKQGKEDHGEDLVSGPLQQDCCFYRRQSALDAMPLDPDLGWEVFHFPFIAASYRYNNDEHEKEEEPANTKDPCHNFRCDAQLLPEGGFGYCAGGNIVERE